MTKSVGSRILVPLDGSALSAQAVSLARALATPDATFVLLHVVRPIRDERGLAGGLQADSETLTQAEVSQDQAAFEHDAERLKDVIAAEQRIEVVVVAGEPAKTIVDQAAKHQCDSIVMGSRGRGALGRLAFGSVADEVSRAATIPVAIVHPEHVDDKRMSHELPLNVMPINRLVVPLDGSESGQLAIGVAVGLAPRSNIPVELLTAVDPLPLSTPGYGQDMGMAMGAADLLTSYEQDARTWLSEAYDVFEKAGVSAEAKLVYGSPASAISDQLKPGDLVVMTSRGRKGFERFVLGSVAEGLIRSGVAPVLLVR